MTAEAWNAALGAAFQASWRMVTSVFALAGVPLLGLALVSSSMGQGGLALRFVAFAVMLPASLFVHELGHGFVYALLVRRRSASPVELFGIGRWDGGTIVRWRLSPGEDAVVAVAGPLTGIACAAPLLLPGEAFLVGFPFIAAFGVHLASLRKVADDGEQVRLIWRGGDDHADRA